MIKGTPSVLLRCSLATMLAASPVIAASAQAQQNTPNTQQAQGQVKSGVSIPVSGLAGPEGGATPSSPVTGTLTVQRFTQTAQGLAAVGTLTAKLEDPTTGAARTIVTRVVVPVVATSGSASPQPASDEPDAEESGPSAAAPQQPACGILHLVLGPLDLNLLGLRIQLNQVVLDVTAVPGAGNLLGNLLCAITGLLDGTGQLAQLVALLNELLALLG